VLPGQLFLLARLQLQGVLDPRALDTLGGGARRVEAQHDAGRVPVQRQRADGRAEGAWQGLHLQQVRVQEKLLRVLQETSCVHHEMQVPRV